MTSKKEPKKSSQENVESDVMDALTEELVKGMEEEAPNPIHKAMDAVDKYMEEERGLEDPELSEQKSNGDMMVLHVQALLDKARANCISIEEGMEESASRFREFIANRQEALEDQRRVVRLCEAALQADRFA